jgi:drug/metabolite transporter (DMT)-like permease
MASTRVSAEGATFAFLLGFVPAALVIPLFHSVRLSHPPTTWGLLLLVGFLFALGNYTLIFAYSTGGRASIVTPMASLYSLVTLPLAVLLLHERIGRREGLGIALAVLAVAALSRETAPPPAFEVVTGGPPATGSPREETP